MTAAHTPKQTETALGAVFFLVGAGFAYGAYGIPSDAGYGGVGPNFLPWVVAIVLMVCGIGLILQSRTTGFLERDDPEGAPSGDWRGFAWVSLALLTNAALIQHAGFILSCTLCFVLAVRGFHHSQGVRLEGLAAWLQALLRDTVIGLAIAAPVFWMFGQLLGIQLPALTQTGWL